MGVLDDKQVLVGVGGSVAAYRACDLIRGLRAMGATVTVAPTKSALAFVSALTFEALSGRPVMSDALEMDQGEIPHIETAYAADLVVIAPASANLIARMACGLADEALLLTLLSVRCPVVIAPAMETRMWEHPATGDNVQTLIKRGAHFVGPAEGPLASGRAGRGRLAPVEDILEQCVAALSKRSLEGKSVVVTAGPTVEDVDPVRFLSNRSSGKMGIEIARAAARLGAKVTLVHGPCSATLPSSDDGINAAGGRLALAPIRSAIELRDATVAASVGADLVILAAAVADYRPKELATEKIKKTGAGLTSIELTPTPDTLATLVQARRDSDDDDESSAKTPLIVGFAAETGDLDNKARAKLARKGCDVICANDVAAPGIGFQSHENAVTMFFAGGRELRLPRATKAEVAHWILSEVVPMLSTETLR